jgi:D-alanyl-D-alanine carboxypeptidase
MRKAACVCALLLLIVCRGLLAQAPASNTVPIAEQQAKGWLAAFNSGNKDTLKAFLEKYRPEGLEHLDGLLNFRAMTGGFELKKVEESAPTSFTALVKEKNSDQFARMVVKVETAEPYKISKLELRAIPRPAEFALPRESETDAIAGWNKYLEAETAADRFSGAALLAKDGKIAFSHAYGLADREKKLPNQLNTQFRIGSMNKMFTAVSIMQLVEAGKINLGDPLGKYLNDYPNKDVATKVTIEELLSHTGGTGDIFGPDFETHRQELRTLDDYVKLYGTRGPEFEPGSRWAYSNYGFILLGVVIEKVSGQSYYDYVREHVFKQAGMTSTDSLPENEKVADRSVGYMKQGPGTWQPNTDTLPWRGTSAGGGYSTVEDLYRFAMALEEHKLLDAAHTEMLTTPKVDRPSADHYGLGFGITEESGMKCVGHGGGAPGMNGDLKICQGAGYVIAVLANLDPPAAQRASGYIADRVPVK